MKVSSSDKKVIKYYREKYGSNRAAFFAQGLLLHKKHIPKKVSANIRRIVRTA